jgi:hypothetical protein
MLTPDFVSFMLTAIFQQAWAKWMHDTALNEEARKRAAEALMIKKYRTEELARPPAVNPREAAAAHSQQLDLVVRNHYLLCVVLF